jgi:hypothetical protein
MGQYANSTLKNEALRVHGILHQAALLFIHCYRVKCLKDQTFEIKEPIYDNFVDYFGDSLCALIPADIDKIRLLKYLPKDKFDYVAPVEPYVTGEQLLEQFYEQAVAEEQAPNTWQDETVVTEKESGDETLAIKSIKIEPSQLETAKLKLSDDESNPPKRQKLENASLSDVFEDLVVPSTVKIFMQVRDCRILPARSKHLSQFQADSSTLIREVKKRHTIVKPVLAKRLYSCNLNNYIF